MNEKEIENLFEQEIANYSYCEIRDVIVYLFKTLLDKKTEISVPSSERNRFNIYNPDFDFSFEVSELNIHIYRNEEGKRQREAILKIKDTLFKKLNLICPYLLARKNDSEDAQMIRKYRCLFREIKEKLDDMETMGNMKAMLEKVKI